jgi:hypothetical protein
MSDESSCLDVAAKMRNPFELNQERPNVIAVTCSEPQAMNASLIVNQVGSLKVIEAEGGLAGLADQADVSQNWLVRDVQANPEIGLVLFCGHHGCQRLPSRESNVVQFAGSGEHCYSQTEAIIWREMQLFRSALAGCLPGPQPVVSGAVYDPEYDWLSIYDEETRLFLPVNVHRFQTSGS